MTESISQRLKSNPFATRFVRPGALDYQFAAGESAATITDRLERTGMRGAIIGPHGSGKSTLLATLFQEFAQRDWKVCAVTLHDGERSLNIDWQQLKCAPAEPLLVIDGYEQLSCWSRWRLVRNCARWGIGLLVTSHRVTTLPTLLTTEPSLAILHEIVGELLQDDPCNLAPATIAGAFTSSGGNLREALFTLYDRYQRKIEHSTAGTFYPIASN